MLTSLEQPKPTASQPHSTNSPVYTRHFPSLTHYSQYIERAEALFAVGLIHITLLFCYPSSTQRSQQWRQRLQHLHIQPHTYHYHNFLSSNAVYVKLYFNPTASHNAATTNTATFTSALQALASRTGNTTVGQNSNNYKTTFQFQRNSPFATGILTTTSITLRTHPTFIT